tara:strand:+ start:194 stop:1030 length:837 start_codon:yes stop_codon:yes gene_type:complete
MGLTSSIEQPLEDINYEDAVEPMLNGEYSSWEDIKRELDDTRMEEVTHLPTTSSSTEEDEEVISDEDVKEDVDEVALKSAVTEFVDEVIGHAVNEYNKRVREEMFAKIPSDDNLYENSLEKHLESSYEYRDEMTNGEERKETRTGEDSESSETNIDDNEIKIIRHAYHISSINNNCFRRNLNNLCEACMEFTEEMNGRRFYEDYNDDQDELPLLNEYLVELLEREHDNIEELKRNCSSLKTSYNLVKDRMTDFCVNNKDLLKTSLYLSLFYYLIVNAN